MRRLRRMERCADVPAIALTGFGRASDDPDAFPLSHRAPRADPQPRRGDKKYPTA
jgi:hypothetical protein